MKRLSCLCAILALILCVFLTACGAPAPQGNPPSPPAPPPFDSQQIQLSFGAMSDTHLGDTNTEESFRRVLRYIKQTVGATPDLYMVSGDLTDSTGSTSEKTEIRLFKQVFEQETARETPLLYCLGPTHDVPSGAPVENYRMLYYSTFGAAYFKDDLQSNAMLAKGFRHLKVKGYHFFAIDWPGGESKSYAQEDLSWLQNELQKAENEDPSKPIFVSVHVPNVSQLTAIFAKFPQIFCFTGHVHNSVAREDSINQDAGFTNVHCGGVNYYRVDGYNRFYASDNPYLNLGDIYAFAQGLVVQVDANQNVRITRVDGYNGATLDTIWDIHTGDLTKYTAQRKFSAKNCTFKEDADLKLAIDGSSLTVSFDAAASGEAGPAQYYKIELLTPNAKGNYQVLEHVELSSQQVFYPNDIDIPDCHYRYMFADVSDLSDFAVVVTAYDCWDTSENALVYTNGNYTHNGQTAGSASCADA